jgi:hypothetical protein
MHIYYFLSQTSLKRPRGKIVEFIDITQVAEFIISKSYSAGLYDPAKRISKNWKMTNVVILDIDDDQPNNKNINDVSTQLKDYAHILAPTKSHKIPKGINQKVCDRYRVILFLNKSISKLNDYKIVINNVNDLFSLKSDKISISATHFFFPSTVIYSLNPSGQLLDLDKLLPPEIEVKSKKIKKDFVYRISDRPIPLKLLAWTDKVNSKTTKVKRQMFIRLLMEQKDFVRSDISGEMIGIGRCIIHQEGVAKHINVETKTLRKWIQELIVLGQLRYYSEDYGKGWKCKDYRALDALAEAIIDTYKSKSYDITKFASLPDTIEDGKWEETLISAVWSFANDPTSDRFFGWVESLPTFTDKPERKNKMIRAWNSMKKRLAEIKLSTP